MALVVQFARSQWRNRKGPCDMTCNDQQHKNEPNAEILLHRLVFYYRKKISAVPSPLPTLVQFPSMYVYT
jgi:hypothetical protein